MRFKPILILFGIFSCTAAFISAASPPPPLALSDFTVNSANPSFTFLGKGFAEIVAFELKKSPAIKLVDREKRNQILEEMEFGMTGLTDPAAQLEMGKLLSVRYLVGGSITDMGGTLLVSLSMVDVETGEVVWNDQVNAAGGKYAYIGAYFGKSLLKYFKASAAKSTEVALKAETEKDAASVVALSQGIAALDKGDKEGAKKELTLAKKIDPGNAVASAFLSKLASVSAKFKVVPERYVSYYNPAYLGGIEQDRLYLNYTSSAITGGYKGSNHSIAPSPDGQTGVWEQVQSEFAGYALPLGGGFGIAFDGSIVSRKESAEEWELGPEGYSFTMRGSQEQKYYSGLLSAGLALGRNLSLGLGVAGTYVQRKYFSEDWGASALPDPYRYASFWGFGGQAAVALRNDAGSLGWDLLVGYGTSPLYVFDMASTPRDFKKMGDPVYLEQTLTLSPFGEGTFIALKQVNDIYLDRAFYYGRLMPGVERWFLGLFSLRAGAEGTLILRDGAASYGWGATGGATLRLWKFDLDLNYTYRQRPAYTLEGIVVPESVIFITLTRNGIFKR